MTTQFDNVTALTKANIYFDGKCVSHAIVMPDGSKKTLGVIFPATLKFGTAAAEIMELNAGKCRIRLDGATEWQTYEGGQKFEVPADSSFDIEIVETLDYICHYL